MGIFFTSGEKKKRAGVYQRYINAGTPALAGAADGVAAAVIRSNWGELGMVKTCASYEEAVAEYGQGGKNDTVFMLKEIFDGGASKVHVVRVGVGTGETKGTVTLMDTASTPAGIVKLTAKCAGDRSFQYVIRQALGDETTKEFLVYENSVLLEKLAFAANQNEIANLLLAGEKSRYFTFERVTGGTGTAVALLSETQFPKGTNPTATNADYANALNLLEAYTWNTLALDTASPAVHQLAANFIKRIYENGRMCFLVIGEPLSVSFEERCAHAKGFNDYRVVYVGGGFVNTLKQKIDGVSAAARIAGMVAAVPSNQSLTHCRISGGVEVMEQLTNNLFEQTIDSGMLTFSTASDGTVWVESGITTLVSPGGEDDEGWKKIKRAKVRFELMNRISASVEPLIGRINNNGDGRATVLQAVKGVLNTMVAEEKLLAGADAAIDEANPPTGDSAWFVITADDVDTLEKMYFVYRFRYAALD